MGIEFWGFIFGVFLVYKLKVGFILICKIGKLFVLVYLVVYDLEYG